MQFSGMYFQSEHTLNIVKTKNIINNETQKQGCPMYAILQPMTVEQNGNNSVYDHDLIMLG